MMESIFSFLPSYFSIIFLAKAKVSKFVSLFLSHIGPKRGWPIKLKDFKSNVSLEQSNKIIYFFYMLIPEIKSWWKNIGVGVVRNGCGHRGHKVNGWMNGWAELIFHVDANSWKLRRTLIILGWLWSKMGMGLSFQWIDESSWIFAC